MCWSYRLCCACVCVSEMACVGLTDCVVPVCVSEMACVGLTDRVVPVCVCLRWHVLVLQIVLCLCVWV